MPQPPAAPENEPVPESDSPTDIPTSEWMTVPVSDSAEYLDREAPTYEDDEDGAA
jgi:hypothetical protein